MIARVGNWGTELGHVEKREQYFQAEIHFFHYPSYQICNKQVVN